MKSVNCVVDEQPRSQGLSSYRPLSETGNEDFDFISNIVPPVSCVKILLLLLHMHYETFLLEDFLLS